MYGFEILEAIPAYETLNFEITTTSPTKCKLTYLPELDFTETPAIWFGKPEFNTKHNVSFRLPEEIEVPETLYASLNISSLEELFSLIVNNDDNLSDILEDDFAEVLEQLSRFVANKDYLIGLLNLTVASIDDNKYYTFIRCADEGGNENDEPVFLAFTINGSYEDLNPPNLLYSAPLNNSELSDSNYTLQVFLDEPAECSFSMEDKAYSLMENEMTCETSKLRMSSIAGGSYECYATTDILQPYIRCLDNPPEITNYAFDIINDFNSTPTNYETNGTTIILTEGRMFNTTNVYMPYSDSVYRVDMILPDYYSCKIGFNGYNYGLMVDLNCENVNSSSPYRMMGSKNCSRQFAPGDYTSYVQCITEVPPVRNVNMESFFLNYSLNAELSVIHSFPGYDEVTDSSDVELRIVVNRNIDDHNVNCGYRIGSNTELYQMYTYGEYQFKRILYNLNPGQYDISFRCIDESGSIAQDWTRFIVE